MVWSLEPDRDVDDGDLLEGDDRGCRPSSARRAPANDDAGKSRSHQLFDRSNEARIDWGDDEEAAEFPDESVAASN